MLMNIQPQFLTSPQYQRFKRRIGSFAMEYIVTIGIRCQQTRSPLLQIDSAEDLEFMLMIGEGGQEILDALVSSGLIDPEGGEYRCLFFEEMNKQLLSNWNNAKFGSMGGRKANESNSTQSKSTQPNSNQLNSTEWVANGNPMGLSKDKTPEEMIDEPF